MKSLYILLTLFPLLGCDDHNKLSKSHSNSNHFQFEDKNSSYHNISDEKRELISVNRDMALNGETARHNEFQKKQVLLNVPLVKQNPELKYGCEVTSLTMVLKYAGLKTNKMELYRRIKKDRDPLVRGKNGDILKWGNPSDGFVGDMTGRQAGYAVFDQPIEDLINQYLPGRALNLTNHSFEEVLTHVSNGYPVVVWTTGDYRLPDRPEGWRHGNQYIKTPLDLHAVVLVGYDSGYVFLNDPLSGRKQVRVSKHSFIPSWKALKSRAVSYQ